MPDVCRAKAFTLVELLVVVSIMTVLLAMLLPSLRGAKDAAVRVKCMTQMRKIVLAAHFYADDNERYFPARNPIGYGYPHETKRTSNSKYDLNEPFLNPYVGDRLVVFCPALLDRISPTTNPGAFEERFCSTQYHVYPKDVFWQVDRPDLSKPHNIAGRAAIWSCFARVKNGVYMAHGEPGSYDEPEGMISAMSDGAAGWVKWEDTEGYWQYGELHYWPKYYE
jgi:prepilin-type N-terminal cleavage/methylation domain-containing protein